MQLSQILALAGLGVALATWGVYLVSIAKNTVPTMPWGSIGLQSAAVAAAVYAIVSTPTAPVIVPSALAATMGGLFLWLLTIRKTPVGEIKVSVGERILPFTAKTADGSSFDSASFSDQRVLLKFFRGSW